MNTKFLWETLYYESCLISYDLVFLITFPYKDLLVSKEFDIFRCLKNYWSKYFMFGLWSQFFLNCFFSFRPIMPLSTIIDTMSLIIIILVATVFENVSLMIVSSLFYISHMIYRNLLILIFLYLCRDFFHFNGFSHFIDSCLFRLLLSWFRESGFIYNSSFVYIRILIIIPFNGL